MTAIDTLDHLAGLSVEALRAEWRARLAEAPPALRTADLMSLALAYRLQARKQGDLNGRDKRRLAELGRKFAEDRDYRPAGEPVLPPGSSIIKAWRGVRYEVQVLEEGFAYDGQRFTSLSDVARHITGTKWNGYVFFGLKARSR